MKLLSSSAMLAQSITPLRIWPFHIGLDQMSVSLFGIGMVKMIRHLLLKTCPVLTVSFSCIALFGHTACLASSLNYDIILLGSDIEGGVDRVESGRSVSLSADGMRIAIRAVDSTDPGLGRTAIYERTGTTWQQLGGNILGDVKNDDSGDYVSLSADGNRVAVGAPSNDSNGDSSGKVRIYEWSGTSWQQLGSDQNGDTAMAKAGTSLSLNQDGSLIAIGIPRPNAVPKETGMTRILEWTGTDWRQIGINIDGDASLDVSGHGVSMNADGSVVAIGAPEPSSTTGETGYTRI